MTTTRALEFTYHADAPAEIADRLSVEQRRALHERLHNLAEALVGDLLHPGRWPSEPAHSELRLGHESEWWPPGKNLTNENLTNRENAAITGA